MVIIKSNLALLILEMDWSKVCRQNSPFGINGLIPRLFSYWPSLGGSSVVVLCASMVSYVAFVLFLFVPHLSFFLCLGWAVLRDCGLWHFLGILTYFYYTALLIRVSNNFVSAQWDLAWLCDGCQGWSRLLLSAYYAKVRCQIVTLPTLVRRPPKGWLANSNDQDQTPHSAASDQGLHCL